MDSKDLQIFHDALLSLSTLFGKEEERHRQQCKPAIEPAFQSDTGLGSFTTPHPAHFEQREHKCNILQFVPRDQLFKLEQQEQQKKTNENGELKGGIFTISPKHREQRRVGRRSRYE